MSLGVLGAEGNASTQERLLKYLKAGRVHPAILLVGPEKENKWQVAKAMAKNLICQKKINGASCETCSACRRVEKEIHPDVLFFRQSDDDALKVDSVRELIHQMEVVPIEAASKVCVIEECHRMNSASSNAFLKTLEEPGVQRYFILLTTQVGGMLPTVLSRCMQFYFKPEKATILFTDEDRGRYERLLSEVKGQQDPSLVLSVFEEKEPCLHFLQFLMSELRGTATRATPALAAFEGWDPYTCSLKFDEVAKLEGRLRSNANYGLMLESLLRQHFL